MPEIKENIYKLYVSFMSYITAFGMLFIRNISMLLIVWAKKLDKGQQQTNIYVYIYTRSSLGLV